MSERPDAAGGTARRPLDYPAWLPARLPSGRPASGRRLRVQGEETIARLVDAGRAAFAEQGYSAARVDDVVALAGTSHGTFYLYFRNKEDLLHRLAVECGEELATLSDELAALPAEVRLDELQAWVERFFAAYRRHAPVIRVWLERRELDPLMQALANESLGGLAGVLQSKLDPAVAAVVDPAVAALGLLSLLERMAAYVVAGGGELSVARATRTAASLTHATLLGRRGGGRRR